MKILAFYVLINNVKLKKNQSNFNSREVLGTGR